ELCHLCGGGGGQFLAAVAGVDVPQCREPIDVLGAVGGTQHRTVTLHENVSLCVIFRVVKRMDKMPPIGIEQRTAGRCMIVHVTCLSACHWPLPNWLRLTGPRW